MKIRSLSSKLRRAIVGLPRHRHSRILHRIHKKHRLSRKTLYYMKEYGPKSHLIHEIVKDSMPIILMSVVITSFAGLALRTVTERLELLIPFIIMLPALNDMIGDIGSMISSKFTTALFLGKIRGNPWESPFVRGLFSAKIKVAIIAVVYLSLLSLLASTLKGFSFDMAFTLKTVLVGIISAVAIVSTLFVIAVAVGTRIFGNKEDPNNLLIPISTSIADLVTMFAVVGLVKLLF